MIFVVTKTENDTGRTFVLGAFGDFPRALRLVREEVEDEDGDLTVVRDLAEQVRGEDLDVGDEIRVDGDSFDWTVTATNLIFA